MMLYTVNMRDGSTYDDIDTNSDKVAVESAVNWIAEKYGVARSKVTMGDLMKHMAVMAVLEAEDPYATNSSHYDSIAGGMSSVVACHSTTVL